MQSILKIVITLKRAYLKLIEEKHWDRARSLVERFSQSAGLATFLLILTAQKSPRSLACSSYIQIQSVPSPGGRHSVFQTCLFLSLLLLMFCLPAAILPNSSTRCKRKGPTQSEQHFSFLFSRQKVCTIWYLPSLVSLSLLNKYIPKQPTFDHAITA